MQANRSDAINIWKALQALLSIFGFGNFKRSFSSIVPISVGAASDKRARLGFNVFRYDVKDMQLNAVGGDAGSNRLVDATEAQGRGFALGITSRE